MNKHSKVLVAGASGLVGSAIVRRLTAGGYADLLTPSRADLDLADQRQVASFFAQQRPDCVFLAAAKVGGIQANSDYPAEFLHANLVIQDNVIHQAYLNGVRQLLFLGSSCIYPKLAPQPIRESSLLTGALEPTNEPYAIAKIAGLKMCEAYNRQYGTRFAAVMPTNLYGPGDNFHPENSHVLPALVRRFHEAKTADAREVCIWGTGTPRREFLYVDDMADGCVFIMELDEGRLTRELCSYPQPNFINLGTGEDVTICELAGMVKRVVGFSGGMKFDPVKPDGTPRKLLDVTRMAALGWRAKVGLREGIEKTYAWFLDHQGDFRK
jgi:GDP-L-fucose synthase